jgi:hypothetical protein
MIYQESFIQFLKDRLGEPVKVTSKNIITMCPWCEYGKKKDHYHMYISTEAPIFHCFHAGCGQSGFIAKFIKKIEGKDLSDNFVIKEKIQENIKEKVKFTKISHATYQIPKLDETRFPAKTLYLNERLKFSNVSLGSIRGLIFDVEQFIKINRIDVDIRMLKLMDYLHTNFIGFLCENQSVIMFRNIDKAATFKHYKLKLQETKFLDYYKLTGGDFNSKDIVLSEGIFDIFTEHIFDTLNIKGKSKLYASALSTSFDSLIKSIVFNEQIFRANVHILSDQGVDLDFYKKLKRFNSYIIDSLTIYYNKGGKDFNDTPIIPEKIIL